VLGVFVTFVAVVTVIPLACTSWLGRWVHQGHERGLIDRHLSRIGSVVAFVLPRSRLISLFGIGSTLALCLVSFTLRPDERNANALPQASEAASALAHMDQAMGGLEFSRVEISWSDAVASDAPEVLEVVREVDDLLHGEPLIGHPLSIRNLIDSLPGEGDAADRISLLELLPPPLKRAFYTPEYRTATVTFRVQDLGIAKYGPVFERLQQGLAAIHERHPHFSLLLSGSAVWRWENLYQIVVDLAASLGTAAVIIFLVLTVAYRSVRIGLISIIPNVFPLAVTGSFLVVSGEALEIVSVCAFTVCLGIAVDDTIHFLTRFQEERQKTDDRHLAIQRAFTGVGTALVMTTVILVAGFSTVLLSDSRDHRLFASMGGLTIATALVGDLILLPALLARFAGGKAGGASPNLTLSQATHCEARPQDFE
jgi:predicted RND superfamily exporter protein